MPTEKRQRQKAGRQARLEAEQKAREAQEVTCAAPSPWSSWPPSWWASPSPSSSRARRVAASATSTTAASHHHHQAGTQGGSGNTSLAPSPRRPTARPMSRPPSTSRRGPQPPAMTIDPSKTYTATVTTDVGPFTIQLDPAQAPQDRQQLRLPGQPALLRLHHLPPGHPVLRGPDR